MRLNIPDCILQINKSNNYIKKLVFEKRTVECQPQKVDCGYVIDLGLDEKVLITNKKDYSQQYNYVLKSIGNKLDSIKLSKWEKFKYYLEEPEKLRKTWENNVFVKQEVLENGSITENGLRKPQVGALYAALANWTVEENEKSHGSVTQLSHGTCNERSSICRRRFNWK